MNWRIAAILLASIISSNARLGESELACGQRYGPQLTDKTTIKENTQNPLLPNALTRTYELDGWKIKIGFLSSYGAAKMVYTKKAIGQAITEKEVEAILKANTPEGQTWKMIDIGNPNSQTKGPQKVLEVALFQNNIFGGGTFERTDGAIAIWNRVIGNSSVTLQTKDVATFEADQKTQKQATKNKIPNF